MATGRSRRDFLADVGRGVLVASVGAGLAQELGLSAAYAGPDAPEALSFGDLEPLVCLMQETPANRLVQALVALTDNGIGLNTLLKAAALANARTFGGEDYVGFHTMMALAPAWHMATELPEAQRPLPVFKVLYRNTNRIQEHGGRKDEVLHPVEAAGATDAGGEALRAAVRRKDVETAERLFAQQAGISDEQAFNDLLYAVQDTPEVHRVVLPYRAWDLLGLIGREQAHTMLRQSVRYCVQAESYNRTTDLDEARTVLPKMLEEHALLGRSPGERIAEDRWIDAFSQLIFRADPEQAAGAAAAALAEGIRPADVGEAISLAANQLVLRDEGRPLPQEQPGKPVGSVHGDSIGVHACDSANAWRNMALAANPRNTFACLILAAYQVALDRVARGGDFLNWEPLPLRQHINGVSGEAPSTLLEETEAAIQGNLQGRASALVYRYGELGHDPRPVFDLMLRYAVSEDGALHAEKYYRTVTEEFASTRPAFRWRQLTALARVTASEYGHPAPGLAEARGLLKV